MDGITHLERLSIFKEYIQSDEGSEPDKVYNQINKLTSLSNYGLGDIYPDALQSNIDYYNDGHLINYKTTEYINGNQSEKTDNSDDIHKFYNNFIKNTGWNKHYIGIYVDKYEEKKVNLIITNSGQGIKQHNIIKEKLETSKDELDEPVMLVFKFDLTNNDTAETFYKKLS